MQSARRSLLRNGSSETILLILANLCYLLFQSSEHMKSAQDRAHTTNRNPTGLNARWGDTHVSFSPIKKVFDAKLSDPRDDHLSQQNPGDNTQKFRTIVSLLQP